MNALSFFAGMGAGIVLLMLVIALVLAIDRRIKGEQRAVNDRSFAQMEKGNELRERRADAMERLANTLEHRIAESLETIVQQKR